MHRAAFSVVPRCLLRLRYFGLSTITHVGPPTRLPQTLPSHIAPTADSRPLICQNDGAPWRLLSHREARSRLTVKWHLDLRKWLSGED